MSFHISIEHFSKSEEIRRYTNEKKLLEKKFKILKYTLGAGNVCVSIHHFRRLRAPQPSYVCSRTTRIDAENESKQKSTDIQAILVWPFQVKSSSASMSNIYLTLRMYHSMFVLRSPVLVSQTSKTDRMLFCYLVAPIVFTFTYFLTFFRPISLILLRISQNAYIQKHHNLLR